MKIAENEFTKNKKIYALVILIIMISNLFSPYGVLTNKVFAVPATGEPYYRLTLLKPSDNPDPDAEDIDDATYYYYYDYMNGTVDTPEEEQSRAIVMELSIEGCNSVNSADIYFRWNTDKFVAGQTTKPTRKGTPYLEAATEYTNNSKYPDADFGITNWGSPVYEILDASAGTLRFTGGIATGSSYLTSGTVVGQFLFLLKDGVTIDDITTDDISLVTGAVGLEQGLQIAYFPDGKTAYHTDGKDYLLFSGFSAGAKQVSSVELKTSPTKTQYYVGETLDFTDGELTIKYDDGSEENISIADAISSGKLTADSIVATNSKKVTLTYDSETVDFEYYVLDSLTISKNLNKMDYEHGDTIEFAGGELTATYKNSAGASTTKVLNIESEIAAGNLIADKTIADVDNKTVMFTYFNNKTASINLTVTDPIASISITKQPNLLTYDDGETINLAGGQITPVTKSGKTLTPVATNASTVTSSEATASIAQATNKWTIAGGDGLQAGNQKITLTYAGKTADITIVVNDTVSGVSITTQATAENKYGTPVGALNFDGLVATITTTGGGTFTVGASSLTIDTTTYNPNSVAKQSLPVKYGTISSTNNTEITLSNYITGISVNFTQTEFEYGTELGNVLAKGTYVENYADGTTSSPKAITSDMVTGYVASPAATLLTNHKYNETLTIKLSTSTSSFDQLPAVATQVITLKDVPVSIDVASKPNKIFYNNGETLLTNGGQIKINYKSGASQNISMGASTVSLTETDGSSINMSPSVSEFVNGKVTKTIKVNYTADGKTFDTSFDITIKDSVDSIAITTNPKLVFEHNDTFDASTGKLTVTYKSGNSEVVSLDEANITETDGTTVNMAPTASEYTNNQLTKTLKVEYAGLTTNYNITLKNTVASITVTAPTKVTYNLNDSTDLTGGKVTVTRKAGDTKDLALTDTKVTVTNFDTSAAGTGKTANVKYTEEGKDYTSTFTYDVVNNITDIEIVAPSKTEYKHGENIATNGTITVKYADGTTSTRTMTESMITENDGSAVNMTPSSYDNSTNKLTKTLKITYTEDGKEGSIDYLVTIINTVKEVTLYGTPKTNYNVNEAIQPGLSILVTRETGTPETIEVTSDMISNFDTTTEGTRTAVITYTENGVTKTVNYEYTVTDSVTSISIDTAVKEAQKYNEELDLTGATIKVISGRGTKVISLEQNMIKAGTYDKTTLGEQTVTVKYGGQQTTFKVNVKDYVTKIAVNPATVTGTYGDTLTSIINNNNVMYTVTYAKAGDKTAVAVAESMVTGYNQNTITAQNLTITYTDSDILSYTNGQDFTATLTVTLQDEISNIVVTAPTADQTYNYGGTLDLTGATITVNYVSGATPKTVTPTVNMVVEKGTTNEVNMSPLASEFTNNKLDKQVTLKYTEDGKEGSIDYLVTIINTVKEVTLYGTPKTNYNVNEAIQPGLSILVTRETGTPETIEVTSDMISNFDTTTEGTRTAVITYTENGVTKTVNYEYTVTDSVTSISIDTAVKEAQKYNEELDLTGATIKVISGRGTKVISLEQNMIKAGTYDKTTLGEQTVTVKYGGQQTTFKVNVKDYVTKIAVNPATVTGTYGDTLTSIINNNNVMYTVTYAKAGDKTAVAVAESMVTGYNQNTITAQNLTITYTDSDILSYTNGQDFTATLTVTLQDEISNIVVTAPTADQTYNYGGTLDLTGATITVNYVSGATPKTVTPTVNMVVEKGTTNAVNMSPLASEFTNNKLNKQVTLKYTEDGKEGNIDYLVTIVNDVKEVSMNATPKTSYNIGESLDLTNGKITIKRATGTDEVIDLTDPRVTVTGFDSSTENTSLTIMVTFTENGITKQTSYEVSVTDTILSMEIETLPKQNYLYNELLDVSAGTIKVTRNSGVEVINMTESMVKEMDNTPFNSKTLGTRNLKVTYGGITKTYEVTVSDYVTGIIITPPTKTNYEYNEALDLTGGTVQKVMASGTIVAPVSLTQSMVSGYDATRIGAQTITINYEGKQGNFGVIVSDNIQTIEMKTTPKTSYKYEETLDVTNGTIEVTRSSGAKEIIAITKNMVTGFNSETLGTQELIVNYNGKQTTYEIEVKDYVKGIEITKPTKLVYNVGETIDLTNGKVKEIMASGLATSPVAMTDSQVTITGFDTTIVGAKTITVKYKGFTKTFSITVVDPTSSMVIKTLPDKLDYKYGEELDLIGGTIQITKTSGSTQILNITKQMISGYNPKKLGSQVITVTYDGKTAEFSVNVEDYVKQLNIKKPTKLEYEYGEELELDGGEVSVVMASGKISDKTALTASMVEGYNKKKEGKQTLKVTYKGLSGKFDVNVVDLVKAISMDKQPNKVKYNYGEELDVTGAVIKVIKSSGIYKIPVTKDMTSGYSATTPGTQIITITYKNETTNFIVIVGEKPAEPVTPVKPEEPTKPDTPTIDPTTPDEPDTPETPSTSVKPTRPTPVKEDTKKNQEEPNVDEIVETPNNTEEPTKEGDSQGPQQPQQEKPTATLGDKDEKENNTAETKMIAGATGLAGLLILLLLLVFKHNTKIYVQEDGNEYVLGGKERLSKNNKSIDVDKFLDGNTYPNKVKIVLDKKIAEKLDKQKIEIKHRGKVTKKVIKYNNEEFEIILKELKIKE